MTDTLFLDIDGVINPLSRELAQQHWGETLSEALGVFGICYSPMQVEEIEMLAESGVNIVWLTTWLDDSKLMTGIGFRPYPYAGNVAYLRNESPAGWWKFDVIRDYIAAEIPAGSRVAWVDDDLTDAMRMQPEIPKYLTRTDIHMLAVCPDSDAGLTPQHVDELWAFFGSPS